MYGAKDFIPERDMAVALGENVTDIQTELRFMEMDGLAERLKLKPRFKAKPGTFVAWKLKQQT